MLTQSRHTCRLGLQDKPCATARVINLLQGAVRAICISRTVQPIRHLQPSFFVIGWWCRLCLYFHGMLLESNLGVISQD